MTRPGGTGRGNYRWVALLLLGLAATVHGASRSSMVPYADPVELTGPEQLSTQELDRLRAGEVLLDGLTVAGLEGAVAWGWFPYDREHLWRLLVDYPSFAEWIPSIEEITSVAWPRPELALVGYRLNGLLRDLYYTLARWHEPPRRVRWWRAGGDLEAVIGGYDLYPDGTTATLLRFYSAVDIGIWIPGFVRRHFSTTAIERFFAAARRELARRYGPPGALALPVSAATPVSAAAAPGRTSTTSR